MISHRDVIEAAIHGLEAEISDKENLVASLRAQLNGTPDPETATSAPNKKRHMSAAGKNAIRDAQRKRWAAVHGQEAPAKVAPAPVKKKRTLSPAQLRAMRQNAKKARATRAAKKTAGGKVPF